MTSTAFKDKTQLTAPGAPLYPAAPETFTWQGAPYPVYDVPMPDGAPAAARARGAATRGQHVHRSGRARAGPIEWRALADAEQHWPFELDTATTSGPPGTRSSSRACSSTPRSSPDVGTIGAVLSSICVAYGFSRFRFPGRNGLFLLLLATIILPFQVTLIPTYAVFAALGWVGTWLPLIVPHFFANAYNVFLLRQYFLDDPARARRGRDDRRRGPVPDPPVGDRAAGQAGRSSRCRLFHFFWAWNEFFLPLIYLQGNRALQPLSVGHRRVQRRVLQEPTLIQAAAIMAMAVPGRRLLPRPARVHARRGLHGVEK